MPNAAEERERTPPSRWVLKWLREEVFWRDVASGTVSTLIVLFLGYVYAILAGYIGKPNMWRASFAVLFLAALVVVTIAYIRQIRTVSKRGDPTGIGVGVLVLIWTPLFVLCAAALYLAATGLIWG